MLMVNPNKRWSFLTPGHGIMMKKRRPVSHRLSKWKGKLFWSSTSQPRGTGAKVYKDALPGKQGLCWLGKMETLLLCSFSSFQGEGGGPCSTEQELQNPQTSFISLLFSLTLQASPHPVAFCYFNGNMMIVQSVSPTISLTTPLLYTI